MDIESVDESRACRVRNGASDISMPGMTDNSKGSTHSIEALTSGASVDISGGELVEATVRKEGLKKRKVGV